MCVEKNAATDKYVSGCLRMSSSRHGSSVAIHEGFEENDRIAFSLLRAWEMIHVIERRETKASDVPRFTRAD